MKKPDHIQKNAPVGGVVRGEKKELCQGGREEISIKERIREWKRRKVTSWNGSKTYGREKGAQTEDDQCIERRDRQKKRALGEDPKFFLKSHTISSRTEFVGASQQPTACRTGQH